MRTGTEARIESSSGDSRREGSMWHTTARHDDFTLGWNARIATPQREDRERRVAWPLRVSTARIFFLRLTRNSMIYDGDKFSGASERRIQLKDRKLTPECKGVNKTIKPTDGGTWEIIVAELEEEPSLVRR